MARKITGLKWARRLPHWPSCIPHPRPRGFKALGARYEKAVGQQLGARAERGVWWEFADANGPGLCQTDFIITGQQLLAVLECKHTWTEEGWEQLQRLYLPVLQLATGMPTIGLLVCKNLVPWAASRPQQTLEAGIAEAKLGSRLATVHWRGVAPLLRAPPPSQQPAAPPPITSERADRRLVA